jgi:hypothetical protein
MALPFRKGTRMTRIGRIERIFVSAKQKNPSEIQEKVNRFSL